MDLFSVSCFLIEQCSDKGVTEVGHWVHAGPQKSLLIHKSPLAFMTEHCALKFQ